MKVLVTGALGWTAMAIIQELHQAGHQIIAFDLPATPTHPTVVPLIQQTLYGSVSHRQEIDVAMAGIDAIVHLAVAVGEGDYQNADIPFATNVKGTYNLLESARQQGQPKVILISSASVHLTPMPNQTVWRSSAGGDHLYDLTKRLQEEIAQDFCQTFGMTVIVLRAGHIVDGHKGVDPHGRPLSTVTYCRGGWVCRHDLATACLQALHLPLVGYHVLPVIGAIQAREIYDIAGMEQRLKFAFATDFAQYS